MTTKDIYIGNNGTGRDEVLSEAESYAKANGFSKKECIRIRLLSEELMGMVEAIAGQFFFFFFIEGGSRKYKLIVNAKVNMDSRIRNELLAASSRKKNDAAKGICNKLKDIFEMYMLGCREVLSDQNYYYMYYGYGLSDVDDFNSVSIWKLSDYKNNVNVKNNTEDWDELEKSIIANLADDVSVGIKGDDVELIVTRTLTL